MRLCLIGEIASISGLRASTLRVAYGTSKAALIHLTRQQAAELGNLGIRVNAVAPGPVDTAMALAVHSPAIRADYHDAIPLNRYGTPVELEVTIVNQVYPEGRTAYNVVAEIPGTDKKDEVVLITAHFDHLGVQDGVIYNGADDDGTGTVALLEIAEAFMAAVNDGHRPRRSILIMPVSGEEKGLLGSEYYADHPVYPLKKSVCDLNIDMIGRVDEKHKGEPQYIYCIGSDKLSTQLLFSLMVSKMLQ